jgi:ribosomal protein S18 acetylase RimI-like enzyme/catechol 2,3-dioxygenase-like lactoylglutathione lyase family enzyme
MNSIPARDRTKGRGMTTEAGAPPKTGWAKLVPELLVSDIGASMEFWCNRLGFAVAYQRPAEAFAYLERPEGAQIMLSQRTGKWETGPLDQPYGRGAMFQVYVADIDPVQRSLEAAGWPLYAGPREVWREVGDRKIGQREIFVLDPDGYLVMVAHDLVHRPLLKELVVRPTRPGDLPDLRAAIVELQEYERRLHTSRLPGEQVADAYLAWLQQQAVANGGVLVAEVGRKFAGFAAGWIVEEENLAETADSNRAGYVADICVMPEYRGQRIAGELLSAIEQQLASAGITRMRIASLAANTLAQATYRRAGYEPYEIVFEKRIGSGLPDLHT